MAARSLHPFPARMAPEIALTAIPKRDGDKLTVIDPMCGSGTVLSVALARGHDAVGEDIDPLAVMMSTLAVSPINTGRMMDEALRATSERDNDRDLPPWGDDDETNQFVDFWFGAKQKKQLVALAAAIARTEDAGIRLALQMALSRIIVTKSPQASLAADTSHSRPHRVVEASDYDVIAGFERSSRYLATSLDARVLEGVGRVALGDARTLNSIPDGSANLAVTSPPYLNALDYLRGHKLALVWFGYTISQLRARRSASIGAERGIAGGASETATRIVDMVLTDAAHPETLKRPMIERFASDCLAFSAQLRRTLEPGALAVLVVGNSTLRGNYIQNDAIAKYALLRSGFRFLDRQEREIPPSQRYMAINTTDGGSSMARRMRTEVILRMRKEDG